MNGSQVWTPLYYCILPKNVEAFVYLTPRLAAIRLLVDSSLAY